MTSQWRALSSAPRSWRISLIGQALCGTINHAGAAHAQSATAGRLACRKRLKTNLLKHLAPRCAHLAAIAVILLSIQFNHQHTDIHGTAKSDAPRDIEKGHKSCEIHTKNRQNSNGNLAKKAVRTEQILRARETRIAVRKGQCQKLCYYSNAPRAMYHSFSMIGFSRAAHCFTRCQ